MNTHGLLLCAKYSVAPNYFGYCGPDKNLNLVDHLKEKVADREVRSILTEFGTLFLNLKFIASQNQVPDVYDEKVVEAYWIGNRLLETVSNRDYAYLLDEKFNLTHKIGRKAFVQIRKKVLTYRLYPHHSFHVFNIFKRTGHDPSFHTLHTMDECRIAWGRVLPQEKKKADNTVLVETKPLVLREGLLDWGAPVVRKLSMEYRRRRFLDTVKPGDLVSFHWGHVCDAITPGQASNLDLYTQRAIDYYNTP